MISLATEFPVKPISDRGTFIAQVISWLRGMSNSSVLDSPKADLERDTVHLQSQNGEELRLREFGRDGHMDAIGFRHDYPDGIGRLWRTETVLRRATTNDRQDLVRLRTQCIAHKPGVRLEAPRKPYFIKMMLRDNWGGRDGDFSVSDHPLWLVDDRAALELARTITRGEASRFLPVVYISAIGPSKWLISQDQIEKLAYDLGGIAHIVVEPSRAFSFQLRDLTAGENAYGGTLAIALPYRGIVRRLYLGLRLQEVSDLTDAVRDAAISLRSDMPSEGWDWTELQEQALRWQRERDRKRLSAEENEQIYLEELANFRDRIMELESQLAARSQKRRSS